MEKWLPVAGFESYDVSDFGRIRRDGRILKGGFRGQSKRPALTLYRGTHASGVSRYIHHLVAIAFIGLPPGKLGSNTEDDWQVNHKDCNKLNNRADNLEYLRKRDNRTHASAHGAYSGESNGMSRLNKSQVLEIRKLLPSESRQSLAVKFGVSVSCIQYIDERRSWKHI